MSHRPDTNDYRNLLLGDVPMMDMRSPGEFDQGAFPCAVSLPLMTDDERAKVGTCYKKSGQQAAIELGHQLVSGESREQRMVQWRDFISTHPHGYLYCFRGGLRSQTVRGWLRDEGIDYPLITGGYKAMRQFLLRELEHSVGQADLVLIAGKTGTGKTRVIEQLPQAVDLEGRAGHRGSSFGQLLEPQPSQINFENLVSIDLMKLLVGDDHRIFLEDEGHLIGRRSLPLVLLNRMKEAPMFVVEHSVSERVEIVIADYVLDLGRRFAQVHGEEGAQLHRAKLQADLYRIRKRLGGVRYQQISSLLDSAFEQQWSSADVSFHSSWIEALLTTYYDPMYEYQLGKRTGKILFRGTRAEVVARAAEA